MNDKSHLYNLNDSFKEALWPYFYTRTGLNPIQIYVETDYERLTTQKMMFHFLSFVNITQPISLVSIILSLFCFVYTVLPLNSKTFYNYLQKHGNDTIGLVRVSSKMLVNTFSKIFLFKNYLDVFFLKIEPFQVKLYML